MTRHQTVLFLLFLSQRGRETETRVVCVRVCVCVIRGWLDIHVALIIVPLSPELLQRHRPGFDVDLIPRDSRMLGLKWPIDADVTLLPPSSPLPKHFLSGRAVGSESRHAGAAHPSVPAALLFEWKQRWCSGSSWPCGIFLFFL